MVEYANTRGEEKTRSSTKLVALGEGWGISPGLCRGPGAAKHCFVLDRKSQPLVWKCQRMEGICLVAAGHPHQHPEECDIIGTHLKPM